MLWHDIFLVFKLFKEKVNKKSLNGHFVNDLTGNHEKT